MKLRQLVLTAAMAVTLAFAGCSKQSRVDIAPLQKAFETGYGQQQAAVDQIATSLKSEDYAGALTQLRQLAKTAKLTPEQQQAVKDVIEKVQQVIADAAAKASGPANKAAGDLQKALPK